MRKFTILTVAAFAGIAFAGAAQAQSMGGCDWSNVAENQSPMAAVDSNKTAPQTPMATKQTPTAEGGKTTPRTVIATATKKGG